MLPIRRSASTAVAEIVYETQSGDPESPFYENLFELWANDRYFPVFHSRERIESVAAERTMLMPGG